MEEPGREIVVEERYSEERLDQFVSRQYPLISRTQTQRLIVSGKVLVNGTASSKSERLKAGDRVTVLKPGLFDGVEPSQLEPQDIPVTIIYEDDYFLAVDKPAGLVVHPGNGNRNGTLVNALLHKVKTLSEGSGPDRPGIVHRLDKDTSGVLIVARTNAAHFAMGVAFSSRTIQKEYVGFCIGQPPQEHGTIDSPLARSRREPVKRAAVHDGKPALTEYWLESYKSGISAMRFRPHTGRTHQLRVHCSSRGFPIVSDVLYGGGKDRIMHIPPLDRPFAHLVYRCFSRHALHARSLTFEHPFTHRTITITAPVPEDFRKAVRLFGNEGLFG
jgi:23S rRNA pseudouridine1911/1915/1917 synthase